MVLHDGQMGGLKVKASVVQQGTMSLSSVSLNFKFRVPMCLGQCCYCCEVISWPQQLL